MMREGKLQIFDPVSIAVIGAGESPGKIGSGLCKSLNTAFTGKIFYVNPRHAELYGQTCYRSVAELPEVPTHAVIAVVRDYVPETLRQCADRGIRNVIVISSGFKEADAKGAALETEMTALCREKGMTLLGPNTLGLINNRLDLNCTFLPGLPAKGNISVVSQSGGVGIALVSALEDRGEGIAKWAGIGNEAGLTAGELLDFLEDDDDTRAIGVCLEGMEDIDAFLETAGRVDRKKPVVILRDGLTPAGVRAAVGHTGSRILDAAEAGKKIEEAGLIEAHSCREAAAMLKALSCSQRLPRGNKVLMLTNTVGPAILTADSLERSGLTVPLPSEELRKMTDEAIGRSVGLENPADISSVGLVPANYGRAAETMLASDEFDILIGYFTMNPHLLLPDRELAEAAEKAGKPAVACFLGNQRAFEAYDRYPETYGIPCYCDPEDAAAAVKALVKRAEGLGRE